jgi:rhamnosyltransferase
MRISVIIPTYNASKYLSYLLPKLRLQTLKDWELLIIDSFSSDGTLDIAKSFGARIVVIPKEEFDHGGTRSLVSKKAHGDILVYMTQDALPVDGHAIESLIKPFLQDEKIGAAYGRQLPRQGAGPIEAHARLFNYPPTSQIKTMSDSPKFGIKTAFISNSFAAYRRTALLSVGGFPSNTILSEDTYVAAKMLLAGWKVAYCGDAMVYHSHNYGFIEELKRYFDIGVFHAREPWIRQAFGQAEGEGMRYVRSEFRYLWNENLMLIPSAILRNMLKFISYKLGTIEQYLPIWLKRQLSMQKRFWDTISFTAKISK